MQSRKVPALLLALMVVMAACTTTTEETSTTTTTATTTTVAETTTTTGAGPTPVPPPPDGQARIHYNNPAGDYADWVLHVWEDADESVTWDSGLERSGETDFGIYWDVKLRDGAETVGFIVHRGDEKDPGPDMFLTISDQGRQVWVTSGDSTLYVHPDDVPGAPTVEPATPLAEGQARIHYHRPDGEYAGFELHVWEDTTDSVTWGDGIDVAGQDDYGVYWDVNLADPWEKVGFIVHAGDTKDPGPDMFLLADTHPTEVWLLSGSEQIFAGPPDLTALPAGDLGNAQAYWVTADTIAWTANDEASTYTLHYSPSASLELKPDGLVGGESVELTINDDGLDAGVLAKFPHLAGLTAFTVTSTGDLDAILRGQHAVSATTSDGRVVDATGLQIPGVLDDVYGYQGPLGVTFVGDTPTVRVWAPTAVSVRLHLFNTASGTVADATVDMVRSPAGVWSATGEPGWNGKYYLYEVRVYSPSTGAIERNLVTDPYSVGLAINSQKSLILDLQDPALAPLGWESTEKPSLEVFEDIVLYELHIRDFSISDESVPEELRGTFKAFTVVNSDGMRHLAGLAAAGLTHVHLMPVFDIATINENKAEWQEPAVDLTTLPVDSPDQQAAITVIENDDGFNWGYDPWHYTVPEGSYSTSPNGDTRILEFREMVQALNEAGLRAVMDVVYNHTNASGQADKSVLDRIVPGYYHRLNANGKVETSTCCANTATEHDMMRKLMVDSVVTWARDYKVDGFRFDLMGHHMVDDMAAVREALDGLTVARDGVDGSKIYVYGEGWDFGEVAGGARGTNATQLNVGGLGIGTFNDRIRDRVRGGSPFEGLQEQGFATGLWSDPNDVEARPAAEQQQSLLEGADLIRIGLAGNLADYQLENAAGQVQAGREFDYNGAPAGYTTDPQEVITYVSAHDNETFFDIVTAKAPLDTPMSERVRMQMMGMSIVGFSQGVAFYHAGMELLRSKSLDKDSYNSGDWFNVLDFSYSTNGWGRGLPVEGKNADRWDLVAELLGEPDLTPSGSDIRSALNHFMDVLEIRKSSPLFRLQTADDIIERVTFHNTGPDQVPGVIVMSISDLTGTDLDPRYELVVVIFNGTDEEQTMVVDDLPDVTMELHPVLAEAVDRTVREAQATDGTFTIPALTTAVFVAAEG